MSPVHLYGNELSYIMLRKVFAIERALAVDNRLTFSQSVPDKVA